MNKITLIFTIFVSLLFLSIMRGLQSEYFAEIISQKINQEIIAKVNGEVSFSKLELGFFPPKTTLRSVQVEINQVAGLDNIQLEAFKVDLTLDLFDIFSNKITINNIAVSDGVLKIQGDETRKSDKLEKNYEPEKILTEIIDKPTEKIKKILPIERVKQVFLEKLYIESNVGGVFVDELSIQKFRKTLNIAGSVSKIRGQSHSRYAKLIGNIDEVGVDIQISDKQLRIKSLELNSLDNQLRAKLDIQAGKELVISNLSANGYLNLRTLLPVLPFQFLNDHRIEGQIALSVSGEGKLLDPLLRLNTEIVNFYSPWVLLDSVNAEIEKKGKDLFLNAFSFIHQEGQGRVSKKSKFYNIRDRRFTSTELMVNCERLNLGTPLYFLRDTLDILKGSLTGVVKIVNSEENLEFRILDNSKLESFLLGSRARPILVNDRLSFRESSIVLKKESLDLFFNLHPHIKETEVPVIGEIVDNRIYFVSQGNKVSFQEIGPIAGIGIKGVGVAPFEIIYDSDNGTRIILEPILEQFEIINIKIDEIQGKVNLSLQDDVIDLVGLKGGHSGAKLTGEGTINIGDNPGISLDLGLGQISSAGLRRSLLSILNEPIKDFLSAVDFIGDSKLRLVSDFSDNGLTILGEANLGEITYGIEVLDDLRFHYNYQKGLLEVDKLFGRQGSGQVLGQILFNTETRYLEYDVKLSEIFLDEIPHYNFLNLGLRGQLNGEFYGNGILDDLSARTVLNVSESNIGNKVVPNSNLTVFLDKNELFMKGNLMGDIVTIDSQMDLASDKKDSYMNLSLSFPDGQILASFLSAHNINDPSIGGLVDLSLISKFSYKKLEEVDLDVQFNEISLIKDEVSLNILDQKIILSNGEIKNWNVSGQGKDSQFSSVGSGKIGKDLRVVSNFATKANILEVVSSYLGQLSGDISGESVLLSSDKSSSHFLKFSGKNVAAKIKGIPAPVDDASFSVNLENKRLNIPTFTGLFGGGRSSASGFINFEKATPAIDISIQLEESNIPLFEKSRFVVSGLMSLKGNKIPYPLKGNISINHGEIFDELDSFASKNEEEYQGRRFLPSTTAISKDGFIVYDLDVSLDKALLLKNSIAEMNIGGNFSVKGGVENQILVGEANVIPATSRVFFKGHEFQLTDGKVLFEPDSNKTDPYINIKGRTRLNEYLITMSLSGKTDNLSINLSSEPSLNQEDIVSLLTLGFTTDISKNLESRDRQSVTSIGIGTLLVDQLKLNKGLDSSLGLKLSVLPEFSSDDQSYLQGRAGGGTGTSKLKTATKIRLQRQISKKMDLSLSSTVGGSVEQKQEMNVNYNLDDNWSLQFVHEIKDADEEESEAPSSTGADIKYRWQF